MAEVEIPGELVLPQPRDQQEQELYYALQESHRQMVSALLKISALLP